MENLGNKIKSCSFLGHRNVEKTNKLKSEIREIVEDLIINHNVAVFIFGSKSNFDALCHIVVSELKDRYSKIKRIVYTCKSETCILEKEIKEWENTYAQILGKKRLLYGFEEEYEHKTKYTAGKASYVERNKAMIEDSDYCIFYYNEKTLNSYRTRSGTAIAYRYAIQKKKEIINLCRTQLDV